MMARYLTMTDKNRQKWRERGKEECRVAVVMHYLWKCSHVMSQVIVLLGQSIIHKVQMIQL